MTEKNDKLLWLHRQWWEAPTSIH